jgi:hypothetical protein
MDVTQPQRRRKLKTAAGILFYQDAVGLHRTLQSLESGVDLMLTLDGRFAQGPAGPNLSIDGSRDIVKQFRNAVLVDCPAWSEFDKRQKYLELCQTNNVDVLLIIDSDEYIGKSADWDHWTSELWDKIVIRCHEWFNVFGVRWRDVGNPTSNGDIKPRIWFRPEEMEYWGQRHSWFRNKFDHFKPTHSIDVIGGIEILQDQTVRTPEHNAFRSYYQNNWLIPNGM